MTCRLLRFIVAHPVMARRQIRVRRNTHNAWWAAVDAHRPQGWTHHEVTP